MSHQSDLDRERQTLAFYTWSLAVAERDLVKAQADVDWYRANVAAYYANVRKLESTS